MGISPKYWGKEGWHFIHYVALNYPQKPTEKDKEIYMNFLNSIEHILPCPICGYHFKKNMQKHPPNLDSQEMFFNWTVDMHNFVNVENGKKKLSHAQALSEITKNPHYLRNGILFSTSAIAIILVMVYLVSKKRK